MLLNADQLNADQFEELGDCRLCKEQRGAGTKKATVRIANSGFGVEVDGLEPTTSALQRQRSPN